MNSNALSVLAGIVVLLALAFGGFHDVVVIALIVCWWLVRSICIAAATNNEKRSEKRKAHQREAESAGHLRQRHAQLLPGTRPRGTSSPRLARSTNFKQKEDHMTKREEQTQARRQLQTAVQSVIDCFIDELSRLDQHTTDIATAASGIMPKTIPSLTEAIQKRRAMGNPAPPRPSKIPDPRLSARSPSIASP